MKKAGLRGVETLKKVIHSKNSNTQVSIFYNDQDEFSSARLVGPDARWIDINKTPFGWNIYLSKIDLKTKERKLTKIYREKSYEEAIAYFEKKQIEFNF